MQLGNGFIDLLLHLRSNTRRAEEVAIQRSSDGDIGIQDCAEYPSPFKLQQSLSCPSQQEEKEDDIAKPAILKSASSLLRSACWGDGQTHRSIFSDSNWLLELPFLTLRLLRRLTGILEVPGMLAESFQNQQCKVSLGQQRFTYLLTHFIDEIIVGRTEAFVLDAEGSQAKGSHAMPFRRGGPGSYLFLCHNRARTLDGARYIADRLRLPNFIF